MFTEYSFNTKDEQIKIKAHPEDKTFTFHMRCRTPKSKRWTEWTKLIHIPSDILIELGYIINMATSERIDLLPCMGHADNRCNASKERMDEREAIKATRDGWETQ